MAKDPHTREKEPHREKTPSSKKEMERLARRPPPVEIRQAVADQFPIAIPDCGPAIDKLNDALNQGCSLRSHFTIPSEHACAAAGAGAPSRVDLVVLIDTSGSMSDEATALSAAAAAAIHAAKEKCPSDLRVCWLGIEGTWPNTRFTQSYRNYLQGGVTTNQDDCRYSGAPVPDAQLRGYVGDREDGAAATMDIAEHFDWRPDAARVVFYLGDEALERGGPQEAADYAAADAAIAVAGERAVTIFTYFGTPAYDSSAAATSAEYRRLATSTAGQFFSAPADNLGGFEAILEQIICGVGGGPCADVAVPKVRPCFNLQWGDGPNDRIETDDVELMCLTASNPYSNVTFKDVIVLISLVTNEDGSAVATLPDRTPSVYVKPLYLLCLGDIPPCNPKDGAPASVTRELVLVSRGAKEGKYSLNIAYCYGVEFMLLDLERLPLELVLS